MKTIIASPKAPKAVGPYSQAVKCGDTLYISGQLPIDGATGAMPESIEDQTRQSLTNLGHILEEAGYSHADIVKTTVLLTDIADFAAMNAVYATFFTKDMPARICYQVSKLPMGAKVEIDAVAVKKNASGGKHGRKDLTSPPIKKRLYTGTTRDSALFFGLVRNRLRSACVCANPIRPLLSGRRKTELQSGKGFPAGSIEHRRNKAI